MADSTNKSQAIDVNTTDQFQSEEDETIRQVNNSSTSESIDVVELTVKGDIHEEMIPKSTPQTMSSPSSIVATTKGTSKVISVPPSKANPVTSTSRYNLSPQQQSKPNRRMMKINGDDTILNLYAATVAMAVSPPQRQRPKVPPSMGNIQPDVTFPKKYNNSTDNNNDSTGIRPEISRPKKTNMVSSGIDNIDDPLLKLYSATVQTTASTRPRSSNNDVSSPRQKRPVKPSTTSTSNNVSPLSKVKSMATGSANKLSSIQLELSDHDEIDSDDDLLDVYTTSPYSINQKSQERSTDDNSNNIDDDVNSNDIITSLTSMPSQSSLLDITPEMEEEEQQYLQFEIAKELDGSSNSRRFQLAIQSRVSALTLVSYADSDDSHHTIHEDDDEYYNDDLNNTSDSTFCNVEIKPDEEEGNILKAKSSTKGHDVDEYDEVEILFQDSTSKQHQQYQQPVQRETKLKERFETGKKVGSPSLLLNKSHSWMRHKLWEQQQQQQPKDSEKSMQSQEPNKKNQDMTKTHLNNKIWKQRKYHHETEMSTNKAMDQSETPLSPISPLPDEKNDLNDTNVLDSTWDQTILYIFATYVIPFTYQSGSTLPQLYLLIELVDIYDTDLYLAGIYLSIALVLRYIIHSTCSRCPRLAAVGGTIITLLGYLILVVMNKIDKLHSATEPKMVQSIFFVLGSVLIGSNEIIVAIQLIVYEIHHPSSSPTINTCDNKTVLRCWELQYRVIQISTIITFATGGVVYEYFDIYGVAMFGLLLLVVQLISLLTILLLEPTNQAKQSISHDFLDELRFSSAPPIPKDFDQSNSSSSTKSPNNKILRGDTGTSFRSILTSNLETIDEAPAIESELDDDPRYNITYYDSERSNQPSTHQSLASNSSGTAELDNRTSTRLKRASVDGINPTGSSYPSINLLAMSSSINIPSLVWTDILITIGVTVQPILNGLVFGLGTLFLFEQFSYNKSTIGYIYAASSLCGMLTTFIPYDFLDLQLFHPFKVYGTFYLFSCTYMILLTAISYLSTYICGLLLMSLFLGLYVRALNEFQCQQSQMHCKRYQRMRPYRQWTRFISGFLVTLLTPILYDILPRLPNMIGSGVCFCFTAVVWIGSDSLINQNEKETTDDLLNQANTTMETVLSDSMNVSATEQELINRNEELIALNYICQIRQDSLIEHNV
jgi:hypothetical protein